MGRADGKTWLALEPLTGRTHQLRVHCAESGWPIVGDPIYGGAPRTGGPGLQLLSRDVVVPLYKNRDPVKVTAPVPRICAMDCSLADGMVRIRRLETLRLQSRLDVFKIAQTSSGVERASGVENRPGVASNPAEARDCRRRDDSWQATFTASGSTATATRPLRQSRRLSH